MSTAVIAGIISAILLGLGTVVGVILNDVLHKPAEKATIELTGTDALTKQVSALVEVNTDLRTEVSSGRQETLNLRLQVGQLEGNIQDLHNLITAGNNENANLREDIAGLKDEVRKLTTEVSGLKEENTRLLVRLAAPADPNAPTIGDRT